jgi:hypothetical protein
VQIMRRSDIRPVGLRDVSGTPVPGTPFDEIAWSIAINHNAETCKALPSSYQLPASGRDTPPL